MSNPFITEKCTAEDAEKLVACGVSKMDGESGRVPWADVEKEAGTEVGYSRGWLVVRWAYHAQHNPNVLVDSTALVTAAFEKAEQDGTSGEFNELKPLEATIIKMRDVQGLSWGEIAVRMQISENKVRRTYRLNGVRKDLGLRNGHGGRFAYDAGELYTDNRKKEGAQIKLDAKGKPKVEDLLNFVPKAGSTDQQKRKQAMNRLLKIQDLLENAATPQAQRDAQKAKFTSLLEQYGITLRDLAVERKAQADKRKGRRAA